MDPSLAHRLGLRPTVPAIFDAARDGMLTGPEESVSAFSVATSNA
jgi:hypothetical protein